MSKRRPSSRAFGVNVFINCPFDAEYLALLRPLLFTVIDLGFSPRIATERGDSSENRIDKIVELIEQSKLSIHDLSRAQSKAAGDFARLNMPFELGISYAARLFRGAIAQPNACLILEKEQYDLKRALSDLAGTDIKSHRNEPDEVVRCVRDWFVEAVGLRNVSSPTVLWYRFNDFASDFFDARARDGFSDRDLNFMSAPEYISFIRDWVSMNRR